MARLQIDIDVNGEAKITKLEGVVKKFDDTQKRAKTNTDKLSSSIKGIATAAVAYIAIDKLVSSVTALTKSAINTTAQFEQFEIVLRTIEGSSEKARKSMEWIEEFATTTPYNLDKVTEGFVKLKSYGLEPTDGLLRTLGDTASAMGKDIIQAVEAIADAVVGENERLKEFGIRAKVTGEQIKYSWTNASGEARQAIVANNSEIIKSTLEAIFSSKYAGAMEDQSKSWNGLISNMQDNWTKFTKNIMSDGLFEYLKAIVIVIGETMNQGFDNAIGGANKFTTYLIDSIKASILSFGSLYDSVETFGDYLDLIGNSFKTLILGVSVAIRGMVTPLITSVSVVFNFIIDQINNIIDMISMLSFGTLSFQHIQHVSWADQNALSLKTLMDAFDQSIKDTGRAWDNLWETGTGEKMAQDFIDKIDQKYADIKNAPTTGESKIDFGDPFSPDSKKEDVTDYKNEVEATNQEVEKVTESMKEFNDTIGSDDYGTFTVMENLNDGFNNFNDTINDVTPALEEATQSVERFIFSFSNTLMNTIQSNANTLRAIGTSSALYNMSYEEALNNAMSIRLELIKNPLDKTIGSRYAEAYSDFISSATSYLTPSNFASKQEYMFAQATIGTQAGVLEGTAYKTADVLDSMNFFLESINQAFADGILTDEEKATIAGVADNVNKKNDELLGESGIVAGRISEIPNVIDRQKYYDNTGLATDQTIKNQEYYNNTDLMKDDTFGLVDVSDLYKGGDINAKVNTITGYATNSALIGTNSVSDYIKKLMGPNGEGISLTNIASGMNDLSVNTGLDVSDLSNLSSITTNTSNTKTATDNVYDALGGSSSGGVGLDNLQVQKQKTENLYLWTHDILGTQQTATSSPGTSWYNAGLTGSQTSYLYAGQNAFGFSEGGFTGYGFGDRDSTGHKPAGVVHDGEWVAPKWMVNHNPLLFKQLESARNQGSFSDGGFTSNVAGGSKAVHQYLFVVADEIKQLNRLMRRVTNGGDAMMTELIA